MSDKVNHPPHYNAGGVECIDAIQAALGQAGFEGFCVGNALKYLWRWKHKGGVEDIEKAAWYLNHLAGKLLGNSLAAAEVEMIAAALPKPAPAKAKPVAPKAKVAVGRKLAARSDRRLQVAQWLAEAGPQQWAAIADRFKVPNGSRAILMKHPWFSKGEGYGAKYELTEAGRAVAQAGKGTSPTPAQ